MIKLIIFIAICSFILVLYVKYVEKKNVFFPTKEIDLTPEDIRYIYEDIFLKTKDNLQINGWFIPQDKAKYTILFFHGNAGNVSHRLDKIILLHEAKLNIFIIDYRGYGKSQGGPTEEGLYLDAECAYDYLVNECSINPDEIILYGESLGTAVAVDLASKRKVKAVILEGAFTSGKDMAKRMLPIIPTFIISYKFDSLSKIKNIEAAVLFLHSVNDEMVPFYFSKKLYLKAKSPKQLVKLNGGHNSAFLDSKEKYTSSIKSFIEKL